MEKHKQAARGYNDDFQFPMHFLQDVESFLVKHLPVDINGKKLFKMKCPNHQRVKRSHSFRPFRIHSSRRKGSLGTRKLGGVMVTSLVLSKNITHGVCMWKDQC